MSFLREIWQKWLLVEPKITGNQKLCFSFLFSEHPNRNQNRKRRSKGRLTEKSDGVTGTSGDEKDSTNWASDFTRFALVRHGNGSECGMVQPSLSLRKYKKREREGYSERSLCFSVKVIKFHNVKQHSGPPPIYSDGDTNACGLPAPSITSLILSTKK